jgi:XTP/dITP diphosphohydrolase
MLDYVTTNPGKVREVRNYLDDGSVSQLDFDYAEIQAPTLEPIAARGAREAYRHAGGPVLVDDAGLFVDALSGFPGPYTAYVEETLGIERVSAIARGAADPARAAFRCVLAYCDGDAVDPGTDTVDDGGAPVKLFEGVVRGRLVEPRGEEGFGYDPVFEHDGTTFAEMPPAEKNAVSHRGRALSQFAEWYRTR